MYNYPQEVKKIDHEVTSTNEVITIYIIKNIGITKKIILNFNLGDVPKLNNATQISYDNVKKDEFGIDFIRAVLDVYISRNSMYENLGQYRTDMVKQEIKNRITETDWTQLEDEALVAKPDWKTYRTNIKDVLTQSLFPHFINWPTPPGNVNRFSYMN